MEQITKTWVIDNMTCIPTPDDCEVRDIGWKVIGTDTHNRSIVGGYGSIRVSYTPGPPYIPYNQLTQDQVINWVKNKLGEQQVKVIEDNVDLSFGVLTEPDTAVRPLPWVPTT